MTVNKASCDGRLGLTGGARSSWCVTLRAGRRWQDHSDCRRLLLIKAMFITMVSYVALPKVLILDLGPELAAGSTTFSLVLPGR
jgi:hypothetical protein